MSKKSEKKQVKRASTRLTKLRRKARRNRQPLFRMPIIISLGSGGGRILSQVDSSKYGAWKVAVNNSERDLALLGKKVDLKVCCGDGGGSGMDLEKGKEDFQGQTGFVLDIVKESLREKHYQKADVIPIVATLGHGFGSGSAVECTRAVRNAFPESIIMCFVVLPFTFEGTDVKKRAYQSLTQLRFDEIPVTPINNQVAAQRLKVQPAKVSITKVYANINCVLSEMLTGFFESLTATENVINSIDRNDLSKIWLPECVLMSTATYSSITSIGASSPQDTEKNLFIDAQLGAEKGSVPITYIIDGNGEVTIGQVTQLNAKLREEYGANMNILKPLIIERERKDTRFTIIRGGMKLEIPKKY